MNRLCFSLALTACTTLAATGVAHAGYVDEVMADNPLLYLRLGETSGTTAEDQTVNNLDGSYQNGATLGAMGIYGGGGDTAVRLDGVNDRVQVLGGGVTGDYTVEAWIKVPALPTAGESWRNIFYRSNTSNESANFANLLQLQSNGKVLHYTYDVGAKQVLSTNAITLNTWNHVVGVYDPAADFMSVWINGVETQVNTPLGNPVTSGNEWLIGQDHGGHGFIKGFADEFAIYDGALSDARVTAHYNVGSVLSGNLVANGSFESTNIAVGTASQGGATTWSHAGGSHSGYLLDNTNSNWFSSGTPDGTQAFTLTSGTATNSYITQQLNDGVNPVLSAAGQQFQITFNAGRRSDGWGAIAGTFTVLLQEYIGGSYTGVDYDLQSYFLGADDGNPNTIDLNVAVGGWSSLVTLLLELPDTLPGGAGGTAGRNIRIAFVDAHSTSSGFAESSLDNVSVVRLITVIPTPAALPAGLAVLAIAAVRRRRRS